MNVAEARARAIAGAKAKAESFRTMLCLMLIMLMHCINRRLFQLCSKACRHFSNLVEVRVYCSVLKRRVYVRFINAGVLAAIVSNGLRCVSLGWQRVVIARVF